MQKIVLRLQKPQNDRLRFQQVFILPGCLVCPEQPNVEPHLSKNSLLFIFFFALAPSLKRRNAIKFIPAADLNKIKKIQFGGKKILWHLT